MANEETSRRLRELHDRIGPLRARLERVHAEIGTLKADVPDRGLPTPGGPYYVRLRALLGEVEAIQEEVRTSFDEISDRIARVNVEG